MSRQNPKPADSIAALRALVHHEKGDLAIVGTARDEYWYDPESSAVDDGNLILKPGNLLATQFGRWRRILRSFNGSCLVDKNGSGDFLTIQEGINFIAARGGGTVRVAPGTYTLAAPIELPDCQLLIASDAPDTRFKAFDYDGLVTINVPAAVTHAFHASELVGTAERHWKIRGIHFYGGGLTGQDFFHNEVQEDWHSEIEFEACWIEGFEHLVHNAGYAAYVTFFQCAGYFPDLATCRFWFDEDAGGEYNFSTINFLNSSFAYDESWNARGGVEGINSLTVNVVGPQASCSFPDSCQVAILTADGCFIEIGAGKTLTVGAADFRGVDFFVTSGAATVAVDGDDWYRARIFDAEAPDITITFTNMPSGFVVGSQFSAITLNGEPVVVINS